MQPTEQYLPQEGNTLENCLQGIYLIQLILRISHVAGREGHAPDFLSYIHIEKKTPVTPVLLTVKTIHIRSLLL